MNNKNFPVIYHALAIVPFIGYFLFRALPNPTPGASQITLPSFGLFVLLCVVYVQQWRFIQSAYKHNGLRKQLALLVASFVVPTLAFFVGDARGLAEFGGDASTGLGAMTAIPLGIAIGAAALQLLAVGNMITILANGQNVVRILGRIAYVLLWILLAGVAWFMYSLAYTLRDPSTE